MFMNKEKLSDEDFAVYLATELDDEKSLAYYDGLVKERRRDFLENCLKITLENYKAGLVTVSKGAYFVGVVKRKTAQQERIERYKKAHYHTT